MKNSIMILLFCLTISIDCQVDFFNFKGPFRNAIAPAGVGLRDTLHDELDLVLWESPQIGYMSRDHNISGIAVADEHVYVACFNQKSGSSIKRELKCINPQGEIKWTYSPSGTQYGSYSFTDIKIKPITAPCYYNHKVYVRMQKGLSCVNAVTGQEIWFSPGMFEESKHPFVVEGHIVIQQTDGKFRGYDTNSENPEYWLSEAMYTRHLNCPHRAEIWHTPTKDYIISSTKSHIYCINPANGQTVWKSDLLGTIPEDKSTIKAENLQMIYFISDEGPNGFDQYCFELFPDTPEKPARFISAIAEDKRSGGFLHQGFLYHGTSRRGATRFICFDVKNDGAELWRKDGWNTFPGQLPTSKDDSYKAYTECLMVDGRMVGTFHRRIGMVQPDTLGIIFLGNSPNYGMSDVNAPAITKDGKLYLVCCATDRVTAHIKCIDLKADEGSKPVITQKSLPDGKQGSWYNQRLWVKSGNGLRSWSVGDGSLPEGLFIDNENHLLYGYPIVAGEFIFRLDVEDEDGDRDSLEFEIEILPSVMADIDSISFEKDTLSITKDEHLKLSVFFYPDTATNKNIVWSVSNDSVITVDSQGNLRSVGCGVAEVQASILNNPLSASCIVNVSDFVCDQQPEIIVVGISEKLKVGESAQAVASIIDHCLILSDSTIIWQSSNSEIATVDSTGKIEAIRKGLATIMISVENVSKELVIEVEEKSITHVVENFDSRINGVSIIPNPVTNSELTIKTKSKDNQNTEVQIFDMSGRMVFYNSFTSISSVKLNVSFLESGLYTIRIKNSEGIFTDILKIE